MLAGFEQLWRPLEEGHAALRHQTATLLSKLPAAAAMMNAASAPAGSNGPPGLKAPPGLAPPGLAASPPPDVSATQEQLRAHEFNAKAKDKHAIVRTKAVITTKAKKQQARAIAKGRGKCFSGFLQAQARAIHR